MGLVALAFELMAFIVFIYILMAVVGWQVIKFIFGWGERHINWTKYPNLNGILFILAILGGWVLLSVPVGIFWINKASNRVESFWEILATGMGLTGAAIIGLGLAALGVLIIVHIIGGFFSWLFDSRK